MWIANRPIEAVRAKDFPPSEGKLPVLISLYEKQPVELPESHFSSILRIECDDLDFDSWKRLTKIMREKGEPTPLQVYKKNLGHGPKFFKPSHAVQIKEFAERARAEKRDILVHCAAGISRSGAVTEVLLSEFPEYRDKGWLRHPNNWIKRILRRAFMGVLE